MLSIAIREITIDDIDDFTALARQLGYEADRAYLERRIMNGNNEEAVFVACSKGRVIGWIDCKINSSYLSKPCGEIVGFVVDENERSRGIGKHLLEHAENWLHEKAGGRIVVRSNIKRERAHNFYQANGYTYLKTSMIFRKEK